MGKTRLLLERAKKHQGIYTERELSNNEKIMNICCRFAVSLIFIGASFFCKIHANIANSLEDFSSAVEYLFKDKEIVFIQIGSNDGVLADPLSSLIKKNHWTGVLVEPIPHLFEKLKMNYAGVPNLNFENVAISDKRAILDFYTIDVNTEWYKTQAPIWADQLGSFYKDHIYNHFGEGPSIFQFQVPCITLQDLVNKYQLSHVDLIHMDTEGHDSTIIASIDFKKIRPKAILFEQGHSYRDPQKFIECLDHLRSNGYTLLLENHVDMLWVRDDKGDKSLAKVQRKLSKLEKGKKERRKAGKAAAKTHERINKHAPML